MPIARNGVSLSIRFILLSVILLLTNLTITFFAYREVHNRSLEIEVSAVAEQALSVVDSNINTQLASINNYSKLILSDSIVQRNYRKGFAHGDLESYRELKFFLSNIINTFPEISAIHLCDFDWNVFDVKSTRQPELILNGDAKSFWFAEAREGRGAGLFMTGESDLFKSGVGKDLISSVRLVNDLETQMPLGALIVSFDKSLLLTGNLPLTIFNRSGVMITDNRAGKDVPNYDPDLTFSSINNKTGWEIRLCSDLNADPRTASSLRMLLFYIVLVNSFFLLAGAVMVSRILVRPLDSITRTMRDNTHRSFQKTSLSSSVREIRNLGEGYNKMIDEIYRLIGRVTEEQKLKREKEWQALQAQIKPHFLYNTFDAVSALALMGRNQDVFTLMSSLGKYYRSSLSGSREIWTLKMEIDLVENYLRILEFRYDDLLELEIEVDPELEELMLPKLILQPLVENAVYHGIKPGRRKGLVRIYAGRTDDQVQISVFDNGVGIDEHRMEEALSSGFGLGGTKERLELYYDREDILSVKSSSGNGTTVNIILPAAAQKESANV